MEDEKEIYLYTDGGALHNPGPAGIGAVIKLKNRFSLKTLHKISRYLGNSTNNQAEYQAVIEALSWVYSNIKTITPTEPSSIKVFLDSELVCNQLNFKYKVKDPKLQPLFLRAYNLARSLNRVSFFHINREENKEADRLVKQAIKKGCLELQKGEVEEEVAGG